MNQIQLHRLDLNLLVVFEVLMRERSVARTADVLNKTPSAVSHALGRLREQLGDPLLVKVDGRMQPSPFALELIEEVRPILHSIQSVVQPPQPFDAATSHRVFRVAVPVSPALVSEVFAQVHAEGPNVGLEWLAPSRQAFAQVAGGELDLALVGVDLPLPDGVAEQVLAPSPRLTFARRGHPAAERWDKAAWLRWPHIVVGFADAYRSTVEERIAKLGIERQVGARIPDVSGVGPLLARTNMIVNHPPTWLVDEIDMFDLQVLEPPVPLGSLEMRFIWSARLGQDPGNRWLRRIVIGSFTDLVRRGEERVRAMGMVRVRED